MSAPGRAAAIARETGRGLRRGADLRSRLLLAQAACKVRLLRRLPDRTEPGRERTATLRDGPEIVYRDELGDLQTVVEIWLREIYRPPRRIPVDTVVDLGAHIGMTSLWLWASFGCRRVVAVEPVPRNVELLRRNLVGNDVPAVVVQAAVGDRDGHAEFALGPESNLGRLLDPGASAPTMTVEVVTIGTVLAQLPAGAPVDLLKADIEGAEQSLFDGDLDWLDRVGSVVLEVSRQPAVADAITARLGGRGFHRVPIAGRPMVGWYLR